MKHLHADVIIAFANGEEVQRYDCTRNTWWTYSTTSGGGSHGNVPTFNPGDQWRIAPKVPSKGELLQNALRKVSDKPNYFDSGAEEFIKLLKEHGYALQ